MSNYFSDNYIGSGAPGTPINSWGGFAYTGNAFLNKSASGLVSTISGGGSNALYYNNANTKSGTYAGGGYAPIAPIVITMVVTIPAAGAAQGYFEFYYGNVSTNVPWWQLQLGASSVMSLTAGAGFGTTVVTFPHPGAGTYTMVMTILSTGVTITMVGVTGATATKLAATGGYDPIAKLSIQLDSNGPTVQSISIDDAPATTAAWTDFQNTVEAI